MKSLKTNPEISIIIVNWNGATHLNELLQSIKKQGFKHFEIILVDNGSTDNSIILTKNIFPHANIIKLDKNYGFAKPNNIGFKKAKGNYILTLNNDLILEDNFLQNLYDFTLKTKKNIFAIGCKMIFYDNREKINSVGIEPLKNGNGINIGKNESAKKYTKSLNIFGPCAGAALYKKEIIDKIGLFDDDYFAYLEDLDLAYRANKYGYRAVYCPTAICYHKRAVTSSRFPFFKLYLIERNRLINIVKHLPKYYLLFESFFTVYFIIKHMLNKKGRSKISSDQKRFFSIKNIPELIFIYLKARFFLIKYIWKLL